MLEAFNQLCLTVADPLLNWMLLLPRDLAVVLLAVGTGAIMTFVRLFTTNQARLRLVAADLKQLKTLARQAKAARDKPTLKRIQTTRSLLGMMKLKAEGLPLLVSIVPIVLLATWGFSRLEFHPPTPDDAVTFVATTPASAIGQVMHITPIEGVDAIDGWVRPIEADATGPVTLGRAAWRFQAPAKDEPHHFVLNFRDHRFTRPLLVGQSTYSPPLEIEPPVNVTTQWQLREATFLGILPGFPAIAMPSWMLAYILLVIPSVILVRKVTGIQ